MGVVVQIFSELFFEDSPHRVHRSPFGVRVDLLAHLNSVPGQPHSREQTPVDVLQQILQLDNFLWVVPRSARDFRHLAGLAVVQRGLRVVPAIPPFVSLASHALGMTGSYAFVAVSANGTRTICPLYEKPFQVQGSITHVRKDESVERALFRVVSLQALHPPEHCFLRDVIFREITDAFHLPGNHPGTSLDDGELFFGDLHEGVPEGDVDGDNTFRTPWTWSSFSGPEKQKICLQTEFIYPGIRQELIYAQ